MMRRSVIFAALVLSFSASATTVIKLDDQSGLKGAIDRGDREAINGLRSKEKDPKVQILLDAAANRVAGDIADSSVRAARCYEPDKVVSTGSRSMFCGLLLAGNDLAEGDIASWSTISQHIKDKTSAMYEEFVRSSLGGGGHQGDTSGQGALDGQFVIDLFSVVTDYRVFEQWPYTTHIHRKKEGPDIIPLVWQGDVIKGKSTQLPFLDVEINGQKVRGLLDTGTSDSIMLSSGEAARLGIDHITPGWQGVNYFGSLSSSASLGNAKEVAIGSVVIDNLPIVIADTKVTVIGLNFFRQLRTISLTKAALTISPLDASTCADPLVMSSLISGGQLRIHHTIEVATEQVDAVLDTGAPMLVYEVRRELPSASRNGDPVSYGHVGIAALNGSPISYATAKDDFTVAGKEHKAMSYPIFKGDADFPFGIGAWLLRDHAIVMDFPKGHLCVRDNNSVSGQ
jgi:hypothetical protein